jgi:hypothetical protein
VYQKIITDDSSVLPGFYDSPDQSPRGYEAKDNHFFFIKGLNRQFLLVFQKSEIKGASAAACHEIANLGDSMPYAVFKVLAD